MAERQMPQNLEAEMSVLGVAFLNKYALEKIVEELEEDMFYSDANRKIFAAIKALHDAKVPLDITTIKEELDRSKSLKAVGGLEYISEVIDSVATASNIDYYIEIVKEKAIVRNLIDTAKKIEDSAYQEGDVASLLDNAEKDILDVVRARQTSEFSPITEVLRKAHSNLERLANNQNPITGLPTGYAMLDKATTGLHPGELIILAARTGMGKTAFALNIAMHAAFQTEKAIAFFTLEMPAESLANRMLSALGGIEGLKLQNGQLQHNDWKRYNEAMGQLAETNIYIEDSSSVTTSEIRAKCRRLANTEKGLGLVVVDYLQLVSVGGRRPNSREQEVAEISRSLKTMALELKVPVIALAQLGRSAEKREKNEPMLADLRESGAIEQDADMVMFINRKDYYKSKEEFEKEKNVPVDIIIAKHRKGSTGKFQLLFELPYSRFSAYMPTEEEQ